MITFLTALALFCTTYAPVQPPAPVTVQHGRAVEYGKNVMEHTYAIRVRQGLVRPGWKGGLASTPYCANIGRVIGVSFRSPVTGRYSASVAMLVVDCSDPTKRWQYDYGLKKWMYESDLDRHLREGLVAESDYQTALQTGWAWYGHTQANVYWRN